MKALPILLACAIAASVALAANAMAQQLDTRFSCGEAREDHGLKSFFADSGTIKMNGTAIEEFSWESSVFRNTSGIECSIDRDDGLAAEFIGDEQRPAWRILLQNPAAARDKRGYDFSHGLNCTVRFERTGDTVHVNPSCPALCGSRENFSEFSFDMKTGKCRYED